MTPTARSLDYCRKHGITAGVVERWNPHAKIRQDFLGFVDIIALDCGALAIQATTTGNAAKRSKKIVAEPRAREWLRNGCRIEVWAWGKRKVKRGGKAIRWVLDRRPVVEDDFDDMEDQTDESETHHLSVPKEAPVRKPGRC